MPGALCLIVNTCDAWIRYSKFRGKTDHEQPPVYFHPWAFECHRPSSISHPFKFYYSTTCMQNMGDNMSERNLAKKSLAHGRKALEANVNFRITNASPFLNGFVLHIPNSEVVLMFCKSINRPGKHQRLFPIRGVNLHTFISHDSPRKSRRQHPADFRSKSCS